MVDKHQMQTKRNQPSIINQLQSNNYKSSIISNRMEINSNQKSSIHELKTNEQ